MNELQLFRNRGDRATQGSTTILTAPDHDPYGEFCPAPGHQLGFDDLKGIELAGFLRAIRNNTRPKLDLTAELHIEMAIHAIAQSANEGRRISLAEI